MKQYYFITYSWRFKGLSHNEIMNGVIDTSPMQSILDFKDSYAAEQYTDYKILFAMPITKEDFDKYDNKL